MGNDGDLQTTPQQLRFDLEIAAEREIDGVQMGVLTDGTPYLTVRGLARMCGISHSAIVGITADWLNIPSKPRVRKIREFIIAQGADDSVAFIAVPKNGTIHHAIPAAVCMAILEYFAFDAKSGNEHAINSYRVLARKGFHDFIYAQIGYNPTDSTEVAWQQFRDRVSLAYHTVPDGYFSVFKELADMYVTLLREGADLGPHFIPDISVGIHWGKYWTAENLDVIYGERIKYPHEYPRYFPQAVSNPQLAYCYPDDALAEYRKWVREIYIPEKMPKYLNQKIRDKHIPAPAARKAIDAFTRRSIENSST